MNERLDMTSPRVLAEVGGLVDEAGITLAIYGEALDPDDITEILKVAPTASHRRGDRRGKRSPSAAQGAWLLSVRCEAPVEPDAALTKLLAQVPEDEGLWLRLAESYDLQLRIGVHFAGWNKGFDISPANLRRLAGMHVKVGLDLYEYGEDEEK